MEKKRLKKYLNLLFLLVVFVLTIWSVFRGQSLNRVVALLLSADPVWIVPSIFCVLLFILGESVVIHYLMKTLGVGVRFSHCCLYSFIGFFYSCITPSASGGQPMQIIAMRKDQIPVAVSTVVLAIVTITYKLVLVLLGAAVLLFRPSALMLYLEPVLPIVYLGMFLNVVFIVLLLLLVFYPGIVRSAAVSILGLVGRIRPFRHPERQAQRLDRIMGQYEGTAAYYRTHKRVFFQVLFITALQRLALFAVTWFTYRAFRLSGQSFPVITSLQGMISVAVDMLPLPGGMGISENLFLDIFRPIFGEVLVLPGMLLSRGISYYTQLIISAVMTVAAAFILREKK